jgi:hypothetical protein
MQTTFWFWFFKDVAPTALAVVSRRAAEMAGGDCMGKVGFARGTGVCLCAWLAATHSASVLELTFEIFRLSVPFYGFGSVPGRSGCPEKVGQQKFNHPIRQTQKFPDPVRVFRGFNSIFRCATRTLLFGLTNSWIVPFCHSEFLVLSNGNTQIQFSRQSAWPHRAAGHGRSPNRRPAARA